MKASEIRSMSAAELESKLVELKKDLFMLRMQHATNHLDNPVKISAVRRDIKGKMQTTRNTLCEFLGARVNKKILYLKYKVQNLLL